MFKVKVWGIPVGPCEGYPAVACELDPSQPRGSSIAIGELTWDLLDIIIPLHAMEFPTVSHRHPARTGLLRALPVE